MPLVFPVKLTALPAAAIQSATLAKTRFIWMEISVSLALLNVWIVQVQNSLVPLVAKKKIYSLTLVCKSVPNTTLNPRSTLWIIVFLVLPIANLVRILKINVLLALIFCFCLKINVFRPALVDTMEKTVFFNKIIIYRRLLFLLRVLLRMWRCFILS